ncbi:MAG: tryptophan--tRNA ligase, partial [Defluviitaleaceae bacterium]|nr:tryptophan--tRNA ligase [Defluviitaleaceae bacterium]
DIAIRFNNIYGDIFTVPEAYIPKSGARIKSLSDPTKKMSKSDEDKASTINLLDSDGDVLKKFKRSVTDSDTKIYYDVENKPGISNLLEIYAAACDITIDAAQSLFDGKGYGDLKIGVAEAVIENITKPIQTRFNDLLNNKDYLDSLIKENAQKSIAKGAPILEKVKKAIGFV